MGSANAKSAAHTPGPWQIVQSTAPQRGMSRDIRIERADFGGGSLGSVADVFAPNGAGERWKEEGLANARLIAAAPETTERLLARYRACRDFNCYGSKDCIYCEGDRAALQKAGVL